MTTIDYYFATLSPYTYLAGMRLEEIAAKHGAMINYKPLDVLAQFARTGGTPPKERHASRQEYRLQELRRQAARWDLPLNLQPAFWPTNMAPSSYAIIVAQKAGGGDLGALVHAVTAACWAQDKNVAEEEVICACLEAAGFDPALANADMLGSAMTYEQNLEDAVTAGAFGAPFYITDTDERFWGQDRLDDLARYMDGLA